ncbi:hypothetical protein CMT69_18440, partial [Elizabethkingia anophelis]|nr:hypothetical protein [Elizabethkingia anophelis]
TTVRTIISDNRQIIAKAIISGNTVIFTYSYTVNPQKAPNLITITVQRGIAGEQTFTGNHAMTGSYFSDSDTYEIKAVGTKPGDEALKESILTECKAIVSELTVIN